MDRPVCIKLYDALADNLAITKTMWLDDNFFISLWNLTGNMTAVQDAWFQCDYKLQPKWRLCGW